MTLKTGNRGFTLIEVMLATAILSLGTVYIYQAFFTSLDAFNYCSDYLNVSSWLNEKIWLTQDELMRRGAEAVVEKSGDFISSKRKFNWELEYSLVDEAEGLYEINLNIFWRAAKKDLKLSRIAYAIYEKPIPEVRLSVQTQGK